MTYRSAIFVAALALAGCSAGRDFPPLAIRPVEGRSWAEPVIAPSAPVIADPALDARLAAARRALDVASRAFETADRRATPLVRAARGDAAGSERWIQAESALAELDAQRAAISDAATSLEDLAAARAQMGEPDYPPLASAQAEAATLLDRDAARIRVLQATIPAG